VEGLAAKDIIDIQVTVASLDEALLDALKEAGFQQAPGFVIDHCPPGMRLPDSELEKRFFNAPLGDRKANIHVRVEGRFNQRYPLLCRDYLRSHPLAASAYGQVKRALAGIVGDDVEAFYDVKDPVFDILMVGAEEWAAANRWEPGASDA
jgi:GrpB-like predicted nucleotidyltransferase (UPF0157 family)